MVSLVHSGLRRQDVEVDWFAKDLSNAFFHWQVISGQVEHS